MEFLQHIGDFFTSAIQISGEQFPFTWGDFFLQFVLPVIIYVVFYKLILLLFSRIIRKSSMKEKPKAKLFVWIRRFFRFLFLILIAVLIGRLFGAKIMNYLRLFFQALSKPFFESGNTKISVITILLTIPIFYIASWASKGVRNLLDRTLTNRISIDEAKKFTIINLLRYGVLVVVLLIGLSIIGINVSSLAVIFGVLGIGLGFGLQNVVANFFAGIILVITHPIKEGDRVLVLDSEGIVIKIRMLSTVINTIMNETIIVPNSQLTNDKVYNYSYDDRRIVLKNEVEISYSSDLDKALEVLIGVGHRNPFRIEGKEPVVRVSSFESSGILLKLFAWLHNVNDKYEAHSWTNLEIWRAFKENGIEIPFPQLDLHFKNAMPPK
jgi:potassium-dependent mechanosensitive channel